MVVETLVEARAAVFGYTDRPVVRVGALTLHPGRCLGIFGPNGSGKSTLLRGIAGVLTPQAGKIERAPGVRVAYLPQLRTIDPAWPMTGFDAATMPASSL